MFERLNAIKELLKYHCDELEEPIGVPWNNHIFKTNVFRHIHVQEFEQKNMKVVHVLLLPNYHIDVPILGFDIVQVGKKYSIFYDETPVGDVKFDFDFPVKSEDCYKVPCRW